MNMRSSSLKDSLLIRFNLSRTGSLPATKQLFPIVMVLLVFGGVCISMAEVGYSMRGNAQPFHNWDSTFNTSSREHFDDGLVLKAGAFGLRPHFGIWVGQIDNVYLDRNEGIEDTYLTIAPGLMLTCGSEEDDYLTLNYVYENTTYDKALDLDYESQLLSLGLHLLQGRFRIHLSDQFSDTTDTDPESAQRTSKMQNIEVLGISREVSRKTTFSVEQRYEIHRYQADDLLDYDEFWVGVRGQHQTFPKVSTHLSGGYGIVDMIDSAVIGDADYLEVNVGLQGRLTAKTALHAQGGWHRRTFEDEIETINEWVALVGLSSRFSSRTDWGIDLSRRLTPSSQREGVTRQNTAIMPSVRHILWRDRLAFSVRGAYEWADYYGPEGKMDRNDTYWYITAILDWHPTQPFTVSIGYTYAEQASDVEDGEYGQNHLFVRAMLNY